MLRKRLLVIGLVAVSGVYAYMLWKRRYILGRKYIEMPGNYEPRPNEVMLCIRPIDDNSILAKTYPFALHSYIKTSDGKFGLQFCNKHNEKCPDVFGPRLMEEYAHINPEAIDPAKHKCFIVSVDPKEKRCMLENAEQLSRKPTFRSMNRWFAYSRDMCLRYTEDLVSSCTNATYI